MNWVTIKNFGKVKYFNISYAVIIIVPLLANTFEVLNEKYGYALLVPLTVKSLYFASISYAIAIALYQYRCPSIIKEYNNLQEYIDKNLKQFENKAPDLKFYIVLAHLDKATQAQTYNEILGLHTSIAQQTDKVAKTDLVASFDKKLNEVYSGTVQAHLTKKYNDENSKDKLSFWTAGILYTVGSVIVLSILIIRTIVVFKN